MVLPGLEKLDMSSQSWVTIGSTMDGSHFSDEMSDEVTIEQQRKEELAAMVPPSEGSVASGSSRRTEQWVDEPVVKGPMKQKRSGPTRTRPTNLQLRKGDELPPTDHGGRGSYLHGEHELCETAGVWSRSR